MIVCPYNPFVSMDDIAEAFYCVGCPDCRLLTSLHPDPDSNFTEEDIEK